MFIHNINPVAFSIGSLDVRFYGLVYFFGFLLGYFYFRYLIKRSKIKHFGFDDLDSFMIYFMLGSIIGARVLNFVFYYPGVIFSDPMQLFRVWEGGMSIHGGIVGAIVAGLLFVRSRKISFYDLADHVIILLMFFLGLGRIANFINGELWGTPHAGRFCIDYSQSEFIVNPPQGCRHPYQLYESLKNFAVGIALLAVNSFASLKKGLLFWYGILAYNVLRFFLDFYRADPELFLGISTGQFLCVLFSLVAIVFIIHLHFFNSNKLAKKVVRKK